MRLDAIATCVFFASIIADPAVASGSAHFPAQRPSCCAIRGSETDACCSWCSLPTVGRCLPNIVFYLAADDIRITGVAIESLARTITPPLGVLSSHFVTPRRNYFRPLVCRASPSPGCVRGSHAAEKARGSRRCPGIARRALAWWPRLIQGYLHGVLRPEAAALRATSAPPLAPGAATLPRRRNPRHGSVQLMASWRGEICGACVRTCRVVRDDRRAHGAGDVAPATRLRGARRTRACRSSRSRCRGSGRGSGRAADRLRAARGCAPGRAARSARRSRTAAPPATPAAGC